MCIRDRLWIIDRLRNRGLYRLDTIISIALNDLEYQREQKTVSYTHLDVYKRQVLLHAGAGGLKEGVPMSELKGNFKAAYDVVKRAERCVLLRSKAANPSHTYAVGNVDGNGLVFGLVLKTDPEAAVREFRTRSFPSWSPWNTSKA